MCICLLFAELYFLMRDTIVTFSDHLTKVPWRGAGGPGGVGVGRGGRDVATEVKAKGKGWRKTELHTITNHTDFTAHTAGWTLILEAPKGRRRGRDGAGECLSVGQPWRTEQGGTGG